MKSYKHFILQSHLVKTFDSMQNLESSIMQKEDSLQPQSSNPEENKWAP